ncbi:MAG: hypothetical protein OXK82_10400 [Deltaproteobacteria bacterium]|nr:hypothetical protein [Deltaproteobacteria bacterium]
MARAAHFAAYLLALGWIIESALALVESGEPFARPPGRILFYYILTVVLLLSWEGDTTFLEPSSKPDRLLLPLGLLWIGAEAAPLFIEWDAEEVLVWWRASLLVAMAASTLAWTAEFWVDRLRTAKGRDTGYAE